MLELTKDLDFEAVGGLTLGADPVATAMMHVAAKNGRKLDSFVVRKAEKAHGLQRRIESPDVKGRRVLAVEDTSTTGGSVLTAVEALKEAGAIVVAVAVIEGKGLETVLTFGTGLGSAIFSDGVIAPHLEISHATIRYGKSIDSWIVNKLEGVWEINYGQDGLRV